MLKTTIMITTARGLEKWLAGEVRTLGMPVAWAGRSGVMTSGGVYEAMRLNLHLRTGHRVLLLLHRCTCATPEGLYREAAGVPWEDVLPADGYVSVYADVKNRTVNDNRFAALRCKDAIVDRIQRRKGRRPDSGPEQTGAVIRLFWRDDRCEIYLDTSGEPLPRRGYRKNPLGAPMQETLAAGVIMATNWKARTPFVNPMCGSGTLAVEAALIAGNRAPGLLRKKFGFMHSLLYDPVGWARLRDEAKKDVRRVRTGIVASDLCAESVGAAMKNAMTAGVDRCIDFRTCDFADTPVPDGAGVIIFNPGYGIRMGAAGGLGPLYRRIGDFLKKECTGYTGYVFTGTPGLAGKIGLKSRRRLVFFSGKLECRLYEYDLYGGK